MMRKRGLPIIPIEMSVQNIMGSATRKMTESSAFTRRAITAASTIMTGARTNMRIIC